MKDIESKSIKQFEATLSVTIEKKYKIQANSRDEAMQEAQLLLRKDVDLSKGKISIIKLKYQGYHEKESYPYYLLES